MLISRKQPPDRVVHRVDAHVADILVGTRAIKHEAGKGAEAGHRGGFRGVREVEGERGVRGKRAGDVDWIAGTVGAGEEGVCCV